MPETNQVIETSVTIPVIGTEYKLQGLLCFPKSHVKSQQYLDLFIVLHGFLGHKDYCYQKLVSQTIAQNKGCATLRFDFMGCGDSLPPQYLSKTIQNDIRDLDSVLEWIRNYNKNIENTSNFKHPSLSTYESNLLTELRKKELKLIGGIGHSRGSHALLAWSATHAIRSKQFSTLISEQWPEWLNLKYHITNGVNPLNSPLKYLVVCSGRYRTSYLMESYINRIPDFKERGGEALTFRQPSTGEILTSWVPYTEIVDLSSIPIGKLLDILLNTWAAHSNTKILTVYGEADHIIPVMDAFLYKKHIEKFQNKNGINCFKFVLVPNADHNFYGKPRAHLNEKKANYNPQVVKAITNWLSENSINDIEDNLETSDQIDLRPSL